MFVGIVYLMTLRGLPGNLYPDGMGKNKINTSNPPFESSQERGRYSLMITMIEDHSLIIDRFKDFIRPDLAWHSNHYYSAFPPGVSFISIPLYLIGIQFNLSQVFTYFLSTIFTMLTVLTFILIGRKINLSTQATALMVIVYCFASVAWAYGVTLSAHPISAFLIAMAYFIALSIQNDRNNFWNFFFLWLVFGLNFYIDYPNLFILLPVLIYALFRSFKTTTNEKSHVISLPFGMLFGAISFILILVPFILINLHYYDKPFVLTNTYNLKSLDSRGIVYSPDNLSNNLFTKKAYATRFNMDQLPSGIVTLLLSADRGLLFFFPIYIFGFVGFVAAYYKKNINWIVILCMFAANLVVYGAFDDPYGGWSFGPRYLIPTLPIFTVLVGIAFDWIKKNAYIKLIFTFLFIYSCAIAITGALTTNAVPPSSENIPNIPYNFVLNIHDILKNYSSSFFYTILFSHYLSVFAFFDILLCTISAMGISIIWLYPSKE